ncbi:MAG: PhnD/SsuA/transferrin family substrate-binding protein [Phycisphaerae bacterium]|nr:PhnD/SsuA/transferrin family substrate-binding protein [Phycisphaerae bacterium]
MASSILLLARVPDLNALQDPKAVRIGVLANRGSERCLEQWGATAEYLTMRIPGYSFEIRPLGHDEVGRAVERGEIAFILANPSFYVGLERFYGVSRIVTLKNLHLGKPCTVYAGTIFCRSDRNDIHDLADLVGRTFMAVDERSFGGWEMAWRELAEHGIDPYHDFGDLWFGGTHDAVVYAVRDGKVDAGTVRSDTLERMAMEGKIRLEEFRVINERHGEESDLPFVHSTRTYPEWPLAKARHTSEGLAQEVALALMQMSPEAPAAKKARCAGWVIPHNYQPVHECLEELHIGPYADYGRMTLGGVVHRYWPWLVGTAVFLVLAGLVSVHVTRLNRRLRRALSAQRRELSDRLRAEEALRHSEQLRAGVEKLASVGRLAAGAAHEINNPLTGVLTFAHLLRAKEHMDEQDKRDLDVIINETSRVSDIVHSLLDFARERPLTKEPLDVNGVIRRTMRLLRNQKQLEQVSIEEDLEENLPSVNVDRNQLEQVLLNLSLNACEAMPDGGTLTISTLAQDGEVLVRVDDTGCGIADEHLDRIFDPFFTTKSIDKATGLGLSVSYGIVQQHGGSLEVDSEEGKGATFTIALPSIQDEQPEGRDERVDE